jgi:hypothetical protein
LLIWKQQIMSKNSFSAAAGGGSAATLHKHKSTELCCSLKLGPGETISSESALESPLLAKAPKAIGSVVTIRKKYAEAVLIFTNSEDAAQAKNPLKTCEIVVKGANKKDYKRKVTVEVLQPKKSEVVVQPVLPQFDISRLPYVSPYTFDPLDGGPPTLSWLDYRVLHCGIFNVSGGGIFLVEPVSDSRRAMCYTKELATTEYRIAHPDYPKTIAKCHEMCKKLNGTYEYGWTFLCQVDIPMPILENSDYWARLRPF